MGKRIYTPEYKTEAAHLVIDTGRPVSKVAREIGVAESTLYKWVVKERKALDLDNTSGLSRDERAELERLRNEVLELRLDNEFLGKAAAFFAAKRQQKNDIR